MTNWDTLVQILAHNSHNKYSFQAVDQVRNFLLTLLFGSFFLFLDFDKIGHLSFQSQSPGDYIVGTYFRSRYHSMAG